MRIGLGLGDVARLDPVSGVGPALPRVKVLDINGNLDATRTGSLRTFMLLRPGAITFSDVPTSNQDCAAGPCELTDGSGGRYTPRVPETSTHKSTTRRGTRQPLTP